MLECARTILDSVFGKHAAISGDNSGHLKGAYVELIHALNRLTGSTTKIKVMPFKRSILNLVEGKADFHIPLIEPPDTDLKPLPYAFSTQTLFQVAFVLYTNKNKPLDVNNLGKYNIATDSAQWGTRNAGGRDKFYYPSAFRREKGIMIRV